jgi:hypothetical protein
MEEAAGERGCTETGHPSTQRRLAAFPLGHFGRRTPRRKIATMLDVIKRRHAETPDRELFYLILVEFELLNNKIDHFMSNTSQALTDLGAKFQKAYAEVTAKIQALTDAVNNNQDNLSPESQAALADLQALGQKFDDIVPDAPEQPAQ